MPFKVVQTIEDGKICLSVIPAMWETGGIMSWPPRSLAGLVMDETSIPGKGWKTFTCIVKRVLPTYELSRKEMRKMEYATDTEDELPTASQRVESGRVADLDGSVSAGAATNGGVLVDATGVDFSHMFTIPPVITQPNTIPVDVDAPDKHLTSHNISLINDCSIDGAFMNNPKILENQLKIMETLNTVLDNQSKIIRQMAKHDIYFNEIYNIMQERKNTDKSSINDITLLERPKPIQTVEELHIFEDNLKKDINFKNDFIKRMSTICTPTAGVKGIALCYQLIDHFFSRQLLLECSWSGNSKNQNEKAAFKFFVNIRQVFFSVACSGDANLSLIETDMFLKRVLKNSRQRFESTLKPYDSSTPKSKKKITKLKPDSSDTLEKENKNNEDNINSSHDGGITGILQLTNAPDNSNNVD